MGGMGAGLPPGVAPPGGGLGKMGGFGAAPNLDRLKALGGGKLPTEPPNPQGLGGLPGLPGLPRKK